MYNQVITTNHLISQSMRVAGKQININFDQLLELTEGLNGWTDQHQILVFFPHLLDNGVYLSVKNKRDTEGLVLKSVIDLNKGAKITNKARNGGGNTILYVHEDHDLADTVTVEDI